MQYLQMCDTNCLSRKQQLILLESVIWTLSIILMFFKPQRFKGWFFPRSQVKPTLLGLVDRAGR
jgi:hypothetical protein